jgi:hypothetical protein
MFQLEGLRPSTIKWRTKLLLNWGANLGMLATADGRASTKARGQREEAASRSRGSTRQRRGDAEQISLELPGLCTPTGD